MFQLDWDPGNIDRRAQQLEVETRRAIAGAFDFQAARSTGQLKTMAPWTDRTSAARNGLHAVTAHARNRFELILAHAVQYGIYLEVCNSGQYQVILPALRLAQQELTKMLDNLWGKL